MALTGSYIGVAWATVAAILVVADSDKSIFSWHWSGNDSLVLLPGTIRWLSLFIAGRMAL